MIAHLLEKDLTVEQISVSSSKQNETYLEENIYALLYSTENTLHSYVKGVKVKMTCGCTVKKGNWEL